MPKVTLRSRSASYRWRDVQFENHVAVVDEATAARAERDPFFGQGRDFWIDTPPGGQAAGGGRNQAPPPDPLKAEELAKLSKTDLAKLAVERGVELPEKPTKDDLIAALTAA